MWNNFSGFIWRGKKCILFSGKSGNDSLCIDGTGNAKAMTSVPSNFPAIQISNSRNWKIGPLLNYDCHRHTNSLNILVPKCCTLSVLFNDVVNCYGYTAPVTDTWLRMKHRWSDTGWEKQPSSAYNRSQWVSVKNSLPRRTTDRSGSPWKTAFLCVQPIAVGLREKQPSSAYNRSQWVSVKNSLPRRTTDRSGSPC